MSDKKLKVTSLQVRDVLGAREFAMEPGQVTVLSGRNGAGKSTAIRTIQSAVGGGNLAKLARVGEDGEEIDPEIVLVLEGNEGEYRVEKSTSKTRVRKQVGDSAGFEDVPQPQRWLSGLFDSRLANPIEFLNAADKDRVLLLLGALPLELDREGLWSAMGLEKKEVGAVPDGLHPLQELAHIREAVFRERTGINRDAKQKAASAEQTRRAAPAVIPDGQEEEIKRIESEIAEADSRVTRKISEAKSEHASKIEECNRERKDAWRQVDAELDKESIRINSELNTRIAEMRAELDAKIHSMRESAHLEALELSSKADERKQKALLAATDITSKADAEKDAALEKLFFQQKNIEAERVELAELREQAKGAVKAKALHEQADTFDKEAEELEELSARMTAAIDALDSYRRSLADNLPIPGLEVEGKEIRVNGVPFDQLNTAQRIGVAVRVSCIRSRDQRLPVVWVDGAEALDTEHFRELIKALKEEGVQAFIGRVDDTDLTVTAE
jgi:energy-coupling factor transporter ATP-binding protein EcfA2